MGEENLEDCGNTLASLVHHAVSTSNEYVENFDRLLATSGDNFLLPREVVEAIRAIMWTNGALTANLFEENQRLYDLMKASNPKLADFGQIGKRFGS